MKRQIKTQNRVVLYELLNDKPDSRVNCLGYEVAILSETGKVQESWQYEATEPRCPACISASRVGAHASKRARKPPVHREVVNQAKEGD